MKVNKMYNEQMNCMHSRINSTSHQRKMLEEKLKIGHGSCLQYSLICTVIERAEISVT